MEFTKVQLRTLIYNHIKNKENGLNDILELTLNAMMQAERREELAEQGTFNKANGYRPGRVYGNGKVLELRIPRDRNGTFYPKVLTLLRNQQEEIDRFVSALYVKGLTLAQVGETFEECYGRHYSSSSIGRMIQWMHEDIAQWRVRPLERRYPVIFIDCIHVKVRRDTVHNEAFYVILAVNEQGTREVIGIESLPTESATGWQELFGQLRDRGLHDIGLIVADGLSGLDAAVAQMWPRTPLQWCVTHIKRQVLGKVRHDDRRELAEDLRQVFQTGAREDSSEHGWKRWQALCEKWQDKYRTFSRLKNRPQYRNGFTYLDFDYRVHAMIYTTNWIERLNRDFRRVLRMRGSMPSEDAVMTLMGKVSVDKRAYHRKIPRLDLDKDLFPDTQTSPLDP
jgi:putative transposase